MHYEKDKILRKIRLRNTREFDTKTQLHFDYIYYKKVSNSLDILLKM
jgi:hypothetical protein